MRFLFCGLLALMVLSACNTMQGIGRDIESAGNAINRTAGDTKENMRKK